MPVEMLDEKLGDCNIVGVTSIFTPQTYQAFEVARHVKKTRPEVLTVAGGGNARAFHELFLDNDFDLVVFGEAEDTLTEICRAFERGESFENIANVAYKTDTGEVRVNPEVVADAYSEDDQVQFEDLMNLNVTEPSTGAQVGNERFDPDRDGSLAALPSPFTLTNKEGLQKPVPSATTSKGRHTRPPSDATYTALCVA